MSCNADQFLSNLANEFIGCKRKSSDESRFDEDFRSVGTSREPIRHHDEEDAAPRKDASVRRAVDASVDAGHGNDGRWMHISLATCEQPFVCRGGCMVHSRASKVPTIDACAYRWRLWHKVPAACIEYPSDRTCPF